MNESGFWNDVGESVDIPILGCRISNNSHFIYDAHPLSLVPRIPSAKYWRWSLLIECKKSFNPPLMIC